MTDPVRLIQVGAGAMGKLWLGIIAEDPEVELAGLVDLDADTARAAADRYGFADVPVASSLAALDVEADALINVTVPAAHLPVTLEALDRGLPVLCEKPMAESVRDCLTMVAAADKAERLLMISQSRRYYPTLTAWQRQLDRIGPIGTLSCQFFKAPRLEGFRARMLQPLLVDMAIHQFDLARKLIGSDPVSVYCRSYNPPWSWFDGDAAADALFDFENGARFAYTGSWVGQGLETSWNGTWRAAGEHGTAMWDGTEAPTGQLGDGTVLAADVPDEPEGTAASLVEFVAALREGFTPQAEGRDNVLSIAMVQAAVRSADTGRPVTLAEILD